MSSRKNWQSQYEQEKKVISQFLDFYKPDQYTREFHENIYDTLKKDNKEPTSFHEIFKNEYDRRTNHKSFFKRFLFNVAENEIQDNMENIAEHINKAFEDEARERGLSFAPAIKVETEKVMMPGEIIPEIATDTKVLKKAPAQYLHLPEPG